MSRQLLLTIYVTIEVHAVVVFQFSAFLATASVDELPKYVLIVSAEFRIHWVSDRIVFLCSFYRLVDQTMNKVRRCGLIESLLSIDFLLELPFFTFFNLLFEYTRQLFPLPNFFLPEHELVLLRLHL